MEGLKGVHEGQQYAQKIGSSTRALVWTVQRVFQDGVNIPHAFMINREDPFSTKTIACSVLADHRHFHPIRRSRINGW
jgi:hypothetical protein